MNDNFQTDSAIEKELASLNPRELSPGFVDRLEKQLAPPVHAGSIFETQGIGRLGRWASVAAVAAMMLVSTWLLWNRSDDDKSSHPKQNAVRTIDAGQPVVLDQGMPSLLAFGKALNDSQIDLNDVLDQHAKTLLPRVSDLFSPASRWQ